jgi:NDP-sugar pyrophosphorylase family protein
LGEVTWVLYGDSYLDIDYRAVLADFQRRDDPALMTVLRNNDQWDRSNVIFRDGKVIQYSKRIHSPEMTHIDYGLSLLRREAIEQLPSDEPRDLVELYSNLAATGQMAGYEVTERFYEIGSPQGLADTDTYLRAPKIKRAQATDEHR